MASNIKSIAKSIYDLEIELQKTSDKEKSLAIEKKIHMLCKPFMSSPLKMMQIDEELQKMLTK